MSNTGAPNSDLVSKGAMSFDRKPRVEMVDDVPPTSRSTPKPAEGKSYSEVDALYVALPLLSKFLPYSFKSLSLRPVRASEQTKFNRAHKEGLLRHLVDGVSATLEPGVSAYSLTSSDFYFVMYWLRVNSYTKVPYQHHTLCEDPKHVARVMSDDPKEALPPESLEIKMLVTSSSLTQRELDASTLDKFYLPDAIGSRYPLGFATMADVVAITEKEDEIQLVVEREALQGDTSRDAEGEFEEWAWLADRASYLTQGDNGERDLESRIRLVQTMSADDIQELEDYIQAATNYGVDEYVTVRCEECGAEKRTKVSISALSFLPSARGGDSS